MLTAAAVTLFGSGFWWGVNLSLKQNKKDLEQIVTTPVEPSPVVPEVCNIGLSDEEKELVFYSGAMEILNNINVEWSDFNENLNNYDSQKDNKNRFLYLAQAKEDMNSITQNLYLLQIKASQSQFISNKFVQTIYNTQYSHQQFLQSYLDELASLFTEDGVSDYSVDVKKFSGENKNVYDFERELTSAMKQARRNIDER